jgi:hypothetical protein
MRAVTVLTAFLVVFGTAVAASGKEPYDPRRAGHPLRIAAYAIHPAGVILDRLIFRPAWYIGGVEPIRTLVGRDLELQDEEIDPLEVIPSPAVPTPEPQP